MNLLPCPFCGEQPNFTNAEAVAYIGCESKKCLVTPGISTSDWYEYSFEDLARVWNSRAAVPERQYLPINPMQYFGLAQHYPLSTYVDVPCTGCKYNKGYCNHPDSQTNDFWSEGKPASECYTKD